MAADDTVVTPNASMAYQYDDNVLRFKSVATAQATIGSAELGDHSLRTEGGLTFDKRIGQQRLLASVNAYHANFSRFTALSHYGSDLLGQWDWHLGPWLGGSIGISNVTALAPFIDFHLLESNIRHQQKKFLKLEWRPYSHLQVMGGVDQYDVRYELASQRGSNRRETVTTAGLDYLGNNGGSIGLLVRNKSGYFPDAYTSTNSDANLHFQQREFLTNLRWNPTSKTSILISAGHAQNQSKDTETNLSSTTARLEWAWKATTKAALRLSGWREIGAYQDLSGIYTLNNGISVIPSWYVTEKIRLQGQIKHETRKFDTTSSVIRNQEPGRKDTFRYLSLSLNYSPSIQHQAELTFYSDQQFSTVSAAGYRATGLMLNVKFGF